MIKLHLLEQRFILMPFLEIYFDVIPWDLLWCHSLRFILMPFLEIYFYATLLNLANCLLKSYQSHQNIKIMKSNIICVSMEINGYHSYRYSSYYCYNAWNSIYLNKYFKESYWNWQ
jgi:hypothetical protein